MDIVFCIACVVALLKLTTLLTLPDRWWAHEHGRTEIISLLKKAGVSEKRRDKDGITPLELNEDEL